MEGLLEFDCIVYLKKNDTNLDAEKYIDMGIPVPEDMGEQQERIVKYSFDASKIAEVRETFVMYKDEWQNAVCASFIMPNDLVAETPPLLIGYNEFKEKVNEYNKKDSQTD